jgi:hypothetical protein
MKRFGKIAAATATFGALAALAGAARVPLPIDQPRYDATGRMAFPADYRSFVFLSSGVDMSYTATPAMAGTHMFDNVFAPQAAYAAFLKTGVWPDKTILVLEGRGGATKGSINRLGVFQTGEMMGVEAHVKDTARFAGGWGFFSFDAGQSAPPIAMTAACYACHRAHAAADTTFVQFYPTLLPAATRLGTLSRSYLAETAPVEAGH